MDTDLSTPAFQKRTENKSGRLPPAAFVLLLATVSLALLWSHLKLLWFDELIELQTDAVGSAAQVLRIQRHYPISLDPALFHLLAHLSTRIFGVNAFGMRLPALLGYLLMQVCLFFFVRRIAGERAALVALALPVLTGTLYYAVEARPYGFLLGIYGLVLLCYQTATRNLPRRSLALAGLALGIACAINAHYFGILLLVPIGLAEFARTLTRRRLDRPVLAAIALGTACFALILPFHAAVKRYSLHYYAHDTVDLHTLTLCYRVLFLSDMQFGNTTQRLVMTVLVLFCAAIFFLFLRQRHARVIDLPNHELILLAVLATLPFFGYVLAIFVTHTMAVRYVFAAMFAISTVIATALAPWLRRTSTVTVTATLLALIAVLGFYHLHMEALKTAQIRAGLALPPQLRAELLSGTGGLIFLQHVFPYEQSAYYEADPALRSHLTLLYSYDRELYLRGRDTNALTADNMRNFTGFPIVSYEQMRGSLGTHHFVVYDSSWDWTLDALHRDGAILRPLGPAFGGTAFAVNFPQQPATLQPPAQ